MVHRIMASITQHIVTLPFTQHMRYENHSSILHKETFIKRNIKLVSQISYYHNYKVGE